MISLSNQQVVWIVVLFLLMFITLHVAQHISRCRERFVNQIETLFAMQDQFYKDLFKRHFEPFSWELYLRGQDDESEQKLVQWGREPDRYGIYVVKSDKLFCSNLDAAFIIAKYNRLFSDNSFKCIIVVDRELMNRPALLFFLDSITPALYRQVESENLKVESSQERRLVYFADRAVGKEIDFAFDKPTVISHYLLSVNEELLFPYEWELFGINSKGERELINHFRFAEWRKVGQTVRFEALSGKPYKLFLFRFDKQVNVKLQIYGLN